MQISVEKLGKRYINEWIFKDFNYTFEQGKGYALTGHNGSGKSTLLTILSGYHLPSTGKIIYQAGDKIIPAEQAFASFTVATPYMELIEGFSLAEHLDFHFKFRDIQKGISPQEVMEVALLEKSANKYVQNFSSGMKQRLKLALAFYTKSDYILLDEPTSNLDAQGIAWYQEEMKKVISTERSVIIASNQPEEYKSYCPQEIALTNFKTS
ncbi:ATP-binding cassette domain-containing protein [Fulvivirga maritima]|uniref:ABC transporter ATP-binding protein n=1 Tax=Fulvivirga maritima TaxID=2904247 RepID=UPI001F2D698C|nr:ATP-binding cassette domain-containing protein [Fulvivirga maritima]UII27254.1 ATP-binding cassette domain-containing protein [Fulvivirga maritima]